MYYNKGLWLVDLVAAVIATSIAGFGLAHVWNPISELLQHDGTALYGALLSAFAALLGFAVAAIAIVAGLVSAAAFEDLRKSPQYDQFWQAFTWTIRILGLTTLLAFIAIFVNQYDGARVYVLAAVVWSSITAASSLIRCGLTLEGVLRMTRATSQPQCQVFTQTQYERSEE